MVDVQEMSIDHNWVARPVSPSLNFFICTAPIQIEISSTQAKYMKNKGSAGVIELFIR